MRVGQPSTSGIVDAAAANVGASVGWVGLDTTPTNYVRALAGFGLLESAIGAVVVAVLVFRNAVEVNAVTQVSCIAVILAAVGVGWARHRSLTVLGEGQMVLGRRDLDRHRAAVLALGLAGAWLVSRNLSLGEPWAPAVACVWWLVMALGAVAAAGDATTLALWIASAGVAPTLAISNAPARTDPTLGLGAMLVLIGVTVMASRLHLLRERGWRDMKEKDLLVKQLRAQVALVEKANQERSRFLGAASHDLRQPMHALGLFAAALEKSLRDSPQHPMVTNMARAVDALEESFSAMLDLSKLDAGVVPAFKQTFPIRDVFRRLYMNAAGDAEERGLSLRFKAGGKFVTSDPQLLERILNNLVQNALRYTHDGGVTVLARSRSEHISLEVWDTGIGIPADELPNIFNEFYQVANAGRDRTRGLGMGLAIVKRLIDLLGHDLEVLSTPGRGTVMRVLVPTMGTVDGDAVTVSVDTLPAPLETDRTVLVIDDEESVRIGMRDLLESWGFVVLLAASIEEACRQVVHHEGVIDIVVSDLRLGGPQDGIHAIARVREAYGAPLPAVLVTGDTSPNEVKRAHDSGHPVLFKPVRTRELYAALQAVP